MRAKMAAKRLGILLTLVPLLCFASDRLGVFNTSKDDLTDRAAKTGEGFTHPDNKPRSDNRWVQLELDEVAPAIVGAYYTGNPATGKVNYVYVEFDKAVDVSKWFAGSGGYVKIGANAGSKGGDSTGVTAANAGSLFYVDPSAPKTLRVDLSVAYILSQSAIRTSGDMPVAFGFVADLKWDRVSGNALDKAAPVLADTVYLKLGSLSEMSETDEKAPDTLIVVYSERPSDAAIRLPQPVTILSGGECRPILCEPTGSNASGSFYRVTYVVDNLACDRFPETGGYVRVNNNAGFDDAVTPPNVQDVADNMKQLLKIERGPLKWTVKVKNNPFRSGNSNKGVTVSLRPGDADAASTGRYAAQIFVFDNLGSLVVDTLVTMSEEDGPTGKYKVINWEWKGYNKNGRLVNSGTYLLDVVCRTPSGATFGRKMYIGVVRGWSSFVLGKNPARTAKSSVGGSVSFFWDGGDIKDGTLFIYDVYGNVVKKIRVAGESAGGLEKRRIGEWDLTGADGRAVAGGSYVVTGTIRFKDGSGERVSAVIGVGE